MKIPDEARASMRAEYDEMARGRARADRVREWAQEWGTTEAGIRRIVTETTRSNRSSGSSRSNVEAVEDPELDRVAAIWSSTRTEKYPYATGPLTRALEIAEANGLVGPGAVGLDRLRRYIKAHGYTRADQARPAPHITLASEHPNHVHQADVSWCRQRYLDPATGRVRVQSYRQGTAGYNNKNLRGLPLYRYLLADHASGICYAQYFTDETDVTLHQFLYGAWAPKKMRHEIGPTGNERWWPVPFDANGGYERWRELPELRDYFFRGAPRMLVLDRASANKSQATRRLCERLGVEWVPAQVARAKGTVESLMWIWETHFEAYLSLQPAPDLQTLNVWALDFLQDWCLRAVHTRHKMTRSQAWGLIEPGQLREVPPWPVFQQLATRDPVERLVHSGDHGGLVHYDGEDYRVPASELIGQRVAVSWSPHHYPKINVRAQDGRVFVCEPIQRGRFGFPVGATVWGEYARHPDTETQRMDRRLEVVRAESLGAVEVYGHEGERPDRPRLMAPRGGAEIPLADSAPLTLTRQQFNRAVRARIQEELGRDRILPHEGAERDRLFEGRETVEEGEVERFVEWCLAQGASQISDFKFHKGTG